MIDKIKTYFSLIKFSHTIFAMPFAFIGFFLGIHESGLGLNFRLLGLIVLCMVFARNAAMAFNRYTDRNIDAKNPRTKNREIPSKKISHHHVLLFIIINALFFVATTFFINKLCFILSPFALLAVMGYSYTKRFTALSHFFLGLSLSLAPLGAYIAVCGYITIIPVLLSLSVLLWVSGFDIIYALQDLHFDKDNNLKSVPVVLGYKKSQFLALLIHLSSLIVLYFVGMLLGPHSYFMYFGALIFLMLILFQHIIFAIYGLKKINTAFFTLNGMASIILAVFSCIELYFF